MKPNKSSRKKKFFLLSIPYIVVWIACVAIYWEFRVDLDGFYTWDMFMDWEVLGRAFAIPLVVFIVSYQMGKRVICRRERWLIPLGFALGTLLFNFCTFTLSESTWSLNIKRLYIRWTGTFPFTALMIFVTSAVAVAIGCYVAKDE